MTDRANIYVKPGMEWLGELISSAIGVDFDEQCPRCGANEQATHHSLCQARDGTPTDMDDETVRRLIGARE